LPWEISWSRRRTVLPAESSASTESRGSFSVAPPSLATSAFQALALGFAALRLRVRQQPCEQVGRKGGVLLLGLVIPDHAEQGGADASDGRRELVEILEQLGLLPFEGRGIPGEMLRDGRRILREVGEAFLEQPLRGLEEGASVDVSARDLLREGEERALRDMLQGQGRAVRKAACRCGSTASFL
jgi:hypothetical protein